MPRFFPKIFTWGNRRPRRLVFAVGLYTIGYNIFDMTYASVAHSSRPAHHLSSRYGQGTWVVITGGAEDVSKEFAKRFAAQGFNLVMVD